MTYSIFHLLVYCLIWSFPAKINTDSTENSSLNIQIRPFAAKVIHFPFSNAYPGILESEKVITRPNSKSWCCTSDNLIPIFEINFQWPVSHYVNYKRLLFHTYYHKTSILILNDFPLRNPLLKWTRHPLNVSLQSNLTQILLLECLK